MDPANGILTDGTFLMVYTVRIAGLGRPPQPQGHRPPPRPPEAR